MIKLQIIPPGGEAITVRVKGSKELTLADWKVLTPIKEVDPKEDPTESTYTMVSVFTGISIERLDKLPMKGVREICDFIGGQLAEAQAGSDKFRKAVEEGMEYVPPKHIHIGGKKWRVPANLDHEITFGQWADMMRWSAPEHEADLCADMLALILVEDGGEYAGTNEEKRALMHECPMHKAFDLCAFFFSKSGEFRNAMSQRSQRFNTWTRHIVGMALRLSPNDTEALISSLKLQS